jgi:hypothetical protein
MSNDSVVCVECLLCNLWVGRGGTLPHTLGQVCFTLCQTYTRHVFLPRSNTCLAASRLTEPGPPVQVLLPARLAWVLDRRVHLRRLQSTAAWRTGLPGPTAPQCAMVAPHSDSERSLCHKSVRVRVKGHLKKTNGICPFFFAFRIVRATHSGLHFLRTLKSANAFRKPLRGDNVSSKGVQH